MAKGVTGKTANNRLGYLEAVHNELHKLDVVDCPGPFSRIRPVRLQERPLASDWKRGAIAAPRLLRQWSLISASPLALDGAKPRHFCDVSWF